MNLFDLINLGTIGTTCWCAAFAATNFGNKFGRLWGFENTLGYKYISDEDSDKMDKYYEQIVEMYKNDEKAEPWAKDLTKLKERCSKYEKSLRYWGQTVKYCVIQKNVRHKLIEAGYTFKKGETPKLGECKDELLNSFSDNKNDLAILVAKKECKLETPEENAKKQ